MKPSVSQYLVRNHLSIKVSGWLGFFAHPIYYLVWIYLIPQPYDNLFLRLSSSLLAIPLILVDFWPRQIQKWLYPCWHFFLMYVLILTCTYLTLQNDLSTMWMMTEVMAVFIVPER